MASDLKRKPAVAGTFYPEKPALLRRVVQEYLEQSGILPARSGVRGLLVPHAGYVYSGPTAACAFRRVAESEVERVVLLGCSHHFSFEGASIVTRGYFERSLFPEEVPEKASFALGIHLGLSLNQRLSMLRMPKESDRQRFLRQHLEHAIRMIERIRYSPSTASGSFLVWALSVPFSCICALLLLLVGSFRRWPR